MKHNTVLSHQRSRIEDTVKALLLFLAITIPISAICSGLALWLTWRLISLWYQLPAAVYALVWLYASLLVARSLMLQLLAIAAEIGTLDGVSGKEGTEFVRVGKNQLIRRKFLAD